VRSGGYYQGSSYWHSITTAEKICAEDGTRLLSPDNQTLAFPAILNWLQGPNSVFAATGDTSLNQFWLGYRKINQSFTGLQNTQILSPWYSNSSYSFPAAAYVNASSSALFPYECVSFTIGSPVIGYQCLTGDISDTRAICEYRHCSTITGKYCVFPFNIGARQYDTCVPFGGPAWCATSVDSLGNVLTTDTCSSTCAVSSCPLGFTPIGRTCIQISATSPNDTVHSVQEASDMCMTMGARLYQPRSILSLRTLLFMNHPLFNMNDSTPSLLAYDSDGTLIALGIFGSQSYAFTYGDGSPFPDALVPQTQYGFAWSTGMPDGNTNNGCVMFNSKQQFYNRKCTGYPDGWISGQKLSYMCEARPLTTVDGLTPNKSCVFPFKVNSSDSWHVSCIYGTNPKVGLDNMCVYGLCAKYVGIFTALTRTCRFDLHFVFHVLFYSPAFQEQLYH